MNLEIVWLCFCPKREIYALFGKPANAFNLGEEALPTASQAQTYAEAPP